MNQEDRKVITHNYIVDTVSDNIEIDSKTRNGKDVIIQDVDREAQRLIQQAKEQAAEMLKDENEKIEEWWSNKRKEDAILQEEAKSNGFEEGFKTGFKKAEKEAEEKYRELIQNAKNLLEESYILKEQIIQDSENEIIELSITIAKKIINRELELDPDIVQNITREILKNIKESEKISIFVNPRYFSYLQIAREELSAELNGQVELSIFPDPSIENGGCIIKTSSGTLDAKIDTQLEEIKNTLLEITGRREG